MTHLTDEYTSRGTHLKWRTILSLLRKSLTRTWLLECSAQIARPPAIRAPEKKAVEFRVDKWFGRHVWRGVSGWPSLVVPQPLHREPAESSPDPAAVAVSHSRAHYLGGCPRSAGRSARPQTL